MEVFEYINVKKINITYIEVLCAYDTINKHCCQV